MGLEVRRVGEHHFVGSNGRGAEVPVGRKGQDGVFSPSELLQVAAAACAAVTGEQLITRRVGEDSEFRVEVSANQHEGAHELAGVHVQFDVDLSALDMEQRVALAEAVDRAVDRLCTVSRTLRRGVPVTEQFPLD